MLAVQGKMSIGCIGCVEVETLCRKHHRGIKNPCLAKIRQTATPTPCNALSRLKRKTLIYRYTWIIDLGELTDFPQSVTWHLEKGLVFCDFFDFVRERFLVHSPQYTYECQQKP